ncbi:hypothetical protein AVI51_01290 [Piscirickettsia salmonis]|uniref:hypothetical protein n=1 Tax=Piscirickettsia salmonis TaxID=1238 RepID=UPI0002D2DBA5|nr:hypothetical protein [Piscirickettsia salmonis]APS45029.1 hypothetical protein AVI48_12020 [Piscirickettsia salmonis]APS48389.1 hypothetical protein AVI49_12625 [Piscirickettsia salmonis]APS49648.1 hypothetical protein AVI50_01325 [Piscirickettsia salmonis]APS52830.1 hypothetical protein AVI51_01290 [Piscirickettsia salmonis]APS56339.1 hypothetical protein AVI52_03265 [Piscirickettsia salmonis]
MYKNKNIQIRAIKLVKNLEKIRSITLGKKTNSQQRKAIENLIQKIPHDTIQSKSDKLLASKVWNKENDNLFRTSLSFKINCLQKYCENIRDGLSPMLNKSSLFYNIENLINQYKVIITTRKNITDALAKKSAPPLPFHISQLIAEFSVKKEGQFSHLEKQKTKD